MLCGRKVSPFINNWDTATNLVPLQWNLRWETTLHANKKWSLKIGGLWSGKYLPISNRTTATRRWSPIIGRSLVRGSLITGFTAYSFLWGIMLTSNEHSFSLLALVSTKLAYSVMLFIFALGCTTGNACQLGDKWHVGIGQVRQKSCEQSEIKIIGWHFLYLALWC